jgi:hypothetical protein
MKVSPRVNDIHERFCGAMQHRYFIRAHMSAMLALVLLSGVLAGRLLLRAGVSNMAFRYPIMVLISYGVFFGLIRMWLAYVCRVPSSKRAKSSGSDSSEGVLDGSGWSGGGGGGGSSAGFSSGGGASGGGGSSGSFGEVEAPAPRQAFSMPFHARGSGSGSGSRSSGGGGGDDGILLLVLFVLLVVAVFGAGAYVVYQSPVILSDAAFHAMLAGGLARTARESHDPGWFGGVLKATAIPFAVVFILSGVFGYEAHRICPGSATARQVLRTCVF